MHVEGAPCSLSSKKGCVHFRLRVEIYRKNGIPGSAQIELFAGEEAVSIQILALRFCHDVIG
jgi:hypothetical protein